MIFSRIKQGIIFIFFKYNKRNDEEIKRILNEKEFLIFNQMSEYDKIHSFNLYNLCKKDLLLKNDEIYLKLALLHDSGKRNYSLFKRAKKVIFGDKLLEKHPNEGYEKLKTINLEVAELILIHHEKARDKKMEIFQKLDER